MQIFLLARLSHTIIRHTVERRLIALKFANCSNPALSYSSEKGTHPPRPLQRFFLSPKNKGSLDQNVLAWETLEKTQLLFTHDPVLCAYLHVLCTARLTEANSYFVCMTIMSPSFDLYLPMTKWGGVYGVCGVVWAVFYAGFEMARPPRPHMKSWVWATSQIFSRVID